MNKSYLGSFHLHWNWWDKLPVVQDQLCSDLLSVKAAVLSLWNIQENETSKRDLVTHNLKQVKGKKNTLHAVVRDLRYLTRLIWGSQW